MSLHTKFISILVLLFLLLALVVSGLHVYWVYTLDISRKTLLVDLSVLFAVFGLALWVRYRMISGLVRRIKNLHDGAQRFAAGDLSVRIHDDSGDELTDLASAFNTMAGAIAREHTQLLAQKQETDRINQNYMEMLGFISHEFRGRLGSALFNLAALKEGSYGELDPDTLLGIGIVQDSLSHLEEITNNYLQLARIETGELVVKRSRVNLRNDIIGPVASGIQRLLQERNMRLAVHVPGDLLLSADLNLLRIVYDNLLGNALKYGSEGSEIRLDAEIDSDACRLSVHNEGPAIDPAHLPKIFDRFRRYDGEAYSGKRGTGLGLFIVKQIVAAHGGAVEVESAEGRGTTFYFSIPLVSTIPPE